MSALDVTRSWLSRIILTGDDHIGEGQIVQISTEHVSPDQLWLHLSNGRTVHLTIEIEEAE